MQIFVSTESIYCSPCEHKVEKPAIIGTQFRRFTVAQPHFRR